MTRPKKTLLQHLGDAVSELVDTILSTRFSDPELPQRCKQSSFDRAFKKAHEFLRPDKASATV